MRRAILLLVFVGLSAAAVAQINSWQEYQPRRNTFLMNAASVVPVAPSALTSIAVNEQRIDLEWVTNAPQVFGQIIQRCSGGSCSDFATIEDLSPAQSSWSDTAVAAGNSYSYRVANYLFGRVSAWSNTATVAPPTPTPSIPNAPSGLNATTVSDTQIDLGWTDNSSNETKFNLDRCTGIDCSSFSEIFEPIANATSQSDTGLTSNTIYCYRLNAESGSGTSGWSNEAGDTTFTPTPTPTHTATPTPTPGACGSSESCTNAVLCFCMEETSGNIVDNANSISLSGTGSMTYQVDDSDAGFSHGVTIPDGTGFGSDGNKAAANIGTSDFTLTFRLKKGALGSNYEVVASTMNGWNGYVVYWTNTSYERIYIEIYNTQYESDACYWQYNDTPGDGNYHTYEIRIDRDGSATMRQDGTLHGTSCDITAVNGDSINGGGLYIGASDASGSDSLDGTVSFFKQVNSIP